MDVVGAVVFCLFGAVAVTCGLYNLARTHESLRWPKAIGTIVSSAVETYRDEGSLMYRPAISYRYSVSGTEYFSKQRAIGGEMGLSWRGPAEKMTARYPAGMTVPVHYDPDDPAEAVLEAGQYKLPLFLIVFGVVFVLFGLFAW